MLDFCQNEFLSLSALITAGLAILAILISFYQIIKHLKNYCNAHFQQKIIIIIFMVPFYSVTSSLTVVTNDYVGYLALVRDIYEAVLIYNFFNLLSSYIAYNADTKEIELDRIYECLSQKGIRYHLWPMNYVLREINLTAPIRGKWFFEKCRRYILQFLIVKPATTFLEIIFFIIDINTGGIAMLLELIVFISVSLSLYFLILFYQILHEELAYAKPLLKFLSVKGILFFTFWQAFFISIFGRDLFNCNTQDEETYQLMINGVESLLVCFEMVILAIMTTIAYSYKDFEQINKKKGWLLEKEGAKDLAQKFFAEVVSGAFSDTLEDLKELKQPFENFQKSQTQITIKSEVKESTENTERKEHSEMIKELPKVIPNFIPNA